MQFTAFQQGFHHLVGRDVPGVAARERIPGMPGDGDDPAAFRVQLRRLADQAEIDAVEARPIAHFDAAEFDAHHGGILPRHGLHVRAVERIGLPVLHFPGVPVGKVVLVAVKDLPVLHALGKLRMEFLRRGFHRSGTSTGDGGEGREYDRQIFHHR